MGLEGIGTDAFPEIRTDALVEIAAWMPTLAAALCAKSTPAELASWAATFSAAQRS